MALIIHIDGGARGNPGPGAAGVVVLDERCRTLFEAGYYLGHTTNNQAEYRGLLLALDAAARFNDPEIAILSDSELLVRQLTGEYRVRAEGLRPLLEQAERKLLTYRWQIRHIPREQNARADEMVNLALERRADVVTIDSRADRHAEPKAAPGNSGDAAPLAGRGPDIVVLARTVKAPDAGVCAAPCSAGTEYVFAERAPPGVCLVALRSLLNTVLGLQHAGFEPQEPPPPVRVRCSRPRCGAEWELTCRTGKTHRGPRR